MHGLVFNGQLSLETLPVPEPAAGEALIRVLRAGVCNTDLEILKGYMGFSGVLGHEFAGVVEKAPESAGSMVGKRVAGEINCVCGHCAYCQRGLGNHCPNRTVLGIQNRNGAFAEYLTLPVENLHLVPEGLSDDAAVFTEPVAAACRIPEQIAMESNDRIAVLGDGKLGQLIVQVLRQYTQHVLCIGKHPWKLALLENLGMSTASSTDSIEPGFDMVVEVTGSPSGLNRALELVRPEGTVVLKSTAADSLDINLSLPVVVNEVRIVGSRCGPFRPALDALRDGKVLVEPMISARYPLADGVEALRRAGDGSAMKVLIDMPAGGG